MFNSTYSPLAVNLLDHTPIPGTYSSPRPVHMVQLSSEFTEEDVQISFVYVVYTEEP
jgi:hypothetical protein